MGSVDIRGIDHLEIVVGNAFQAMHFYRTAFGFTPVAYAGLETAMRDRSSYVMEQGKVKIVLSNPLNAGSDLAPYLHLHGDSVRDVAFRVPDAAAAFEIAVGRGAKPVREPCATESDEGRMVTATIGAFGDCVHSFVERDAYQGTFAPRFESLAVLTESDGVGIEQIDHVAVGMSEGDLAKWVDFYVDVLGFHESQEEMIFTERAGMNSKVVEDPSGSVKFPIVEPAGRTGKTQIDEYLAFHAGCGTQHVAFACQNIYSSVDKVRSNGVNFLRIPDAYYDGLEQRVGGVPPAEMEDLRRSRVLMDRDDYGRLLQTFTKPITGRPTMFLELIERRGSRGFGKGNIQALFEAVEREQILRGTL